MLIVIVTVIVIVIVIVAVLAVGSIPGVEDGRGLAARDVAAAEWSRDNHSLPDSPGRRSPQVTLRQPQRCPPCSAWRRSPSALAFSALAPTPSPASPTLR